MIYVPWSGQRFSRVQQNLRLYCFPWNPWRSDWRIYSKQRSPFQGNAPIDQKERQEPSIGIKWFTVGRTNWSVCGDQPTRSDQWRCSKDQSATRMVILRRNDRFLPFSNLVFVFKTSVLSSIDDGNLQCCIRFRLCKLSKGLPSVLHRVTTIAKI